ncbi:hypothetical protein C7446_2855 [Kushneria sinocarnis]|uniref:Uncharacterized protein n=1 Tax=Kushneria sinocarnis TaxID=595502 RepID=A0A420WTA7_9GAMM|nr:hypothetical protein [Kushneria sinocarnis]RKQ96265.1 hypothetical protein C7446_2855 [Kushneria sinocarnis]
MQNRTELRISLDDGAIDIPYKAGESDHGRIYPYQSLVAAPELISRIPEVEEFPELRRALLDINRPNASFETARVLTWRDSEQGYITCCAIGFHFRNRALFAQQGQCMLLAGRMLNEMLFHPLMATQITAPMLEIQRANLIAESCSGWIMDLYLAGHSEESQSAADDELEQRVAWFAAFLHREG